MDALVLKTARHEQLPSFSFEVLMVSFRSARAASLRFCWFEAVRQEALPTSTLKMSYRGALKTNLLSLGDWRTSRLRDDSRPSARRQRQKGRREQKN
jgi:hypothetical protein